MSASSSSIGGFDENESRKTRIAQGREDLRRDPARDEEPAGRPVLQREIPGLRAVDRDEETQGLAAEAVAAREAEPADHGGAVLHPEGPNDPGALGGVPFRLEEVVEMRQALSGKQAVPRDPPEPSSEKPHQAVLDRVARTEIGVAPLRGQRLVPAREGREARLSESRPGADQADRSARLGVSGAESRDLPRLEIRNPQGGGDEVVQDPDPPDSRLRPQPPFIHDPGEFRDRRTARAHRTGDAESRRPRRSSASPQEVRDDLFQAREFSARVLSGSPDLEAPPRDLDDRDRGLRPADVSGQNPHRRW